MDLHQPLEGTDAGESHYCRLVSESHFCKVIWVSKRICRPGDAWQRRIRNVIVALADGLG